MEAATDTYNYAFRVFGAGSGMAGVLLGRRYPARLRAALSDVRQQPAAHDSWPTSRSRLQPKYLVARPSAIRGVGGELAQESSLGCERRALRPPLVAGRHRMVRDLVSQGVKACERREAGKRDP